MWIDFRSPYDGGRTVVDSSKVYRYTVSLHSEICKDSKGYYTIIAQSEDIVRNKQISYRLGIFKTQEKANNTLGDLGKSLKDGSTYFKVYDDWEAINGSSY